MRKLAKELGISEKSARIIEISSVKSCLGDLQSGLGRNVKLYSVHPLFGTLANRFVENSLVVISESPPDSIDCDSGFIERMFPHFRIFTMPALQHDKLMANLLTVPHFHALSFGDQASEQKRPENIRSPSFDYMYELSRRTLSESGKVYYEIQAANPFAERAMDDSIASMKKIESLLKNEKAFRKFFKKMQRAI